MKRFVAPALAIATLVAMALVQGASFPWPMHWL
jgi:hypothetical protein